MQEYKFFRIDRAIKNPLTLLDDMESGDLSRDAAKAIKHVYPEYHAEVVGAVAQGIYETKAAGNYLPMSKIAMLGLVLDAPVDSTQTPEYIGAVQQALNSPPLHGQAEEPPPTPQPGLVSQGLSPLMTISQKASV
jgi:hypothetical protein